MTTSSIFYIKRNDTYKPITVTLMANGVAVDLTLANSVMFIMRLVTAKKSTVAKVNAAATIDTPKTSGIVHYDWVVGDTDTEGVYNSEWEVHWAGGGITTFPDSNYSTVNIVADLG